jgi:hypothetical protein
MIPIVGGGVQQAGRQKVPSTMGQVVAGGRVHASRPDRPVFFCGSREPQPRAFPAVRIRTCTHDLPPLLSPVV